MASIIETDDHHADDDDDDGDFIIDDELADFIDVASYIERVNPVDDVWKYLHR